MATNIFPLDMSLVDIILSRLNIKIGERFQVARSDFSLIDIEYYITAELDVMYNNNDGTTLRSTDIRLVDLITGKIKIINVHFVPKRGETYWTLTFRNNGDDDFFVAVVERVNYGEDKDYNNWAQKNCFRTRADAQSNIEVFTARIKSDLERLGWC